MILIVGNKKNIGSGNTGRGCPIKTYPDLIGEVL